MHNLAVIHEQSRSTEPVYSDTGKLICATRACRVSPSAVILRESLSFCAQSQNLASRHSARSRRIKIPVILREVAESQPMKCPPEFWADVAAN